MNQRHTQTINDLTLSYVEWGQGTPLLLLHGLGDQGLVWQGVAERLATQFRCIAPDLRGHGNSDKPPKSAYGSDAIAQDLETFAHQLQLPPLTVVAHSWAAKVALIWARQHPTRLQTLILVDPFFVNRLPGVFRPTFPILYRTLPFLKTMGPFPSYEAAEAIARTLKQYRDWTPLQQAVFQASLTQADDGTWRSKFAIAARNGVFADILQQAGLTTPLDTPTLLLLPEAGLNRANWQLRPYHRYLKHLNTLTIAGNHWPHLVEPEAVSQAIMDDLGDIQE